MGSPRDGPPVDGPHVDGPHVDGPPRDGPPVDGPPVDGPPRDGPPVDGPPRDGPPVDGPPRDGPPVDGPPRDGPPVDGPPRDGPPRDGPPRDEWCQCRDLELVCDGGTLQNIPSVALNVTMMSLQRNRLRKLNGHDFYQYQNLRKLYLSFNQISILPPGLFQDLHRLEWLILEHNKIHQISSMSFTGLNSLVLLSIEGLEISNIQRRMFDPLQHLTHIYFKRFQYCGYAPHVRSCKPNTDGISSLEDLLANPVLRLFVWVVSVSTCLGNAFVICMRSYVHSENKLHAMCIISLCFPGPVVGSLAMLSTEVSVLLLTYLTLEKYVCIVFPFRYVTPGRRRTIAALLAVWTLGLCIAFLPLVCSRLFRNFYGTNGVCFPLHSEQQETPWAHGYSVVIFLGVNLLAFLIIVMSYASMFSNIRTTQTSNHMKKEVAVAQRFFSIVITDSLCWIPIFILKVLSLLQMDIPGTICSWVVIFILPINSALNPILYTLTTRPFKERLVQVWSNYRQQRPLLITRSTHHHASLTWQEVWPLQENSQPCITSPEKVQDDPPEKVRLSPPDHLHLPPRDQILTTPTHEVRLDLHQKVKMIPPNQIQTTPPEGIHPLHRAHLPLPPEQ
ncbi:hypothetical protein NHX12_010800 [Muraenolepis orangiensis]|uniref:G-protein coupled receptors family 1 profile domain-containing protein n=1 Tax=Muraenolepis orangiensis TaxID=630683 RepID=A0A9Q0I535_9TELE|nr:hypothetical protein NHX12_010800 [Muraenolepis orangiensis]